MADEDRQEAESEKATSTDEQKKAPSLDEVLSQIDALKKAQSGSDRKVLELSNALTAERAEKEKLIKERMSEKERVQFELDQQKKQNEATAATLAERELALERAGVITELEIPKSLAEYVNGKDRDSLISSARRLMESFNAEVLKAVNQRLAGGPKPQSGEQTTAGAPDWNSIWSMPAGPKKEAAMAAAFATLKGQQIITTANG